VGAKGGERFEYVEIAPPGRSGVICQRGGIFAIVVIVLILLFAWYGFFGGGHWFGNSSGGSGINVTVHTSP